MSDRFVGVVYLLGLIPLHRRKNGIALASKTEQGCWWEAFRSYRRWVQSLILLGVCRLKLVRSGFSDPCWRSAWDLEREYQLKPGTLTKHIKVDAT